MPLRVVFIVTLAFSALVTIWLGVVVALPKPFESDWIAGIYERKSAAAERYSEPRFLLIGGSGTHFSYSAETASRLTGLPVVNFGTHAGLGAEYLVYRAKQELRAGDTAILAMEHHLHDASGATTILAPYVLTTDRGYLFAAPPKDVPTIVFGYPPVEVVRQVTAASRPWTSPLYQVAAVTPFGDESANTPDNKLPHMLEALRRQRPLEVAVRNPTSPPAWLRDFAQWAKEHDVRLMMTWPVTLDRPEYDDAAYLAYFARHAETYRRLGFQILGEPNDFQLPETEMLDTRYHADTVGAARAGQALARSLCALGICDQSRTNSVVPQ